MGVVYEAEHTRLGQRVALKMLLPELLRVEDLVRRFEREARAASQLRSRHTARVMDVDLTAEGVPYMVMELLEGNDLDAELEQRKRLPLEEAVDYMLQACGAMDEAHALGIVHRDLKPSNVFLANERGTRIAKILDFGISKVSNEADAKLTSAEAVMGTAMYMAPEQVRASRNVDSRADIWSLGVVLYELISGRAPFQGTPTQVAAAIVTEDPPPISGFFPVPPGVAEALGKCLARDPGHRYATVRDLMRALVPFAPPASQGAMTAQQLLGAPRADSPLERSVSTAGPRVREPAGTDAAWAQPAPARGTATTIVGIVSVVIALGLAGFIISHFVGGSVAPKPPVASAPSEPSAAPVPSSQPGPSMPSLATETPTTPAAPTPTTLAAPQPSGKGPAPAKPLPVASTKPVASAVPSAKPVPAPVPPPTAPPQATSDISHF